MNGEELYFPRRGARPIDRIAPPYNDVEQQRQLLWEELEVFSLEEVLRPWQSKTGVDIYQRYRNNFNNEAK